MTISIRILDLGLVVHQFAVSKDKHVMRRVEVAEHGAAQTTAKHWLENRFYK